MSLDAAEGQVSGVIDFEGDELAREGRCARAASKRRATGRWTRRGSWAADTLIVPQQLADALCCGCLCAAFCFGACCRRSPPHSKLSMSRVDTNAALGPFKPIWRYFGYDEPNYTYMKDGRKLIGELPALSPVPVDIRAHHLLVTGDGTPALKWGSTNAYTEDAGGQAGLRLDDRGPHLRYLHPGEGAAVRRDRIHARGALHQAAAVRGRTGRATNGGTGWTYPPKDYDEVGGTGAPVGAALGGALRQGARSSSGAGSCGTSPTSRYWRGTPEEYNKLYDYTADAVKRALPAARVGGPGTTGPGSAKAAAFLKQFLEHCARTNAHGKTARRSISSRYHAKGSPKVVTATCRWGSIRRWWTCSAAWRSIDVVPAVPQPADRAQRGRPGGLRRLLGAHLSAEPLPQRPDVPELHGGGATARSSSSQTATRPTSKGMLTWAFEFEGQPYFDGFRTLATNGVDKPVLNFFRMAGMMKGDRVKVESERGRGARQDPASGVREQPISTHWRRARTARWRCWCGTTTTMSAGSGRARCGSR